VLVVSGLVQVVELLWNLLELAPAAAAEALAGGGQVSAEDHSTDDPAEQQHQQQQQEQLQCRQQPQEQQQQDKMNEHLEPVLSRGKEGAAVSEDICCGNSCNGEGSCCCPDCTSSLEDGRFSDVSDAEAAATAGGDKQETPAYAEAAEHSLTETTNSSSCGCTGSTSVNTAEGMAADSIGSSSSSSSSSRRQLTEDLVLALSALFQQQLANTSSKQVGGW
jgi:hypothetical protein